MSRLIGQDTMLFDGDCGICTKSAQLAEKLDTDNLLQVIPYFDFSESELAAYGLTYADCTEYLRVVTKDGRVYSAANAVNYCGLKLWPLSPLFALLHLFPFILPFEAIVYDLVARNRTKISGMLGLNACTVRRPDEN